MSHRLALRSPSLRLAALLSLCVPSVACGGASTEDSGAEAGGTASGGGFGDGGVTGNGAAAGGIASGGGSATAGGTNSGGGGEAMSASGGVVGIGGNPMGGSSAGGGAAGAGGICAHGDQTNDGCNTCFCSDGQWGCTDRYCPPPCEDGTTTPADDGCNTCACSSGTWACTKRACVAKACGGFVGATCSETEFCAYVDGQDCGTADQTATCLPRPTACATDRGVVCGCDNVTYPNECEANRAGTGVSYGTGCTTPR